VAEEPRDPQQPGAVRLDNARAPAGADDTSYYPGKRFGLPRQGPMSVATLGRRLAALFVDWLLCLLIAAGLFHVEYLTIVLFAVETYVLTAVTGTTIGKRLLSIKAVRTDGKPPGFGWAAVRTLLLLAVVPALLYDDDRRGIHDRAANTIVIRTS
jgi:uncharacterized RDD family membrane protein YckC